MKSKVLSSAVRVLSLSLLVSACSALAQEGTGTLRAVRAEGVRRLVEAGAIMDVVLHPADAPSLQQPVP